MANLLNTNINGSLVVTEEISVGGKSVLTLAPTYTFTKTINLTEANTWYDTGIIGSDMDGGTYLMQIFLDGKGSAGQWAERISGLVAWYSGTTNSTNADEIPVSKAGHAPNSHNIKCRILRVSGGGHIKLQMSDTIAWRDATIDTVFYFKRLI